MPDPEPIAEPIAEPIVEPIAKAKVGANLEPLLASNALLQQAEQKCRRRLANDPDNQTVLASLGQVYRKQGNLTEAATIYRRLTLLNPEDQEAAYMHAILSGTAVPDMPPGIHPAPFVFLRDF